jgi:hypothetical protein
VKRSDRAGRRERFGGREVAGSGAQGGLVRRRSSSFPVGRPRAAVTRGFGSKHTGEETLVRGRRQPIAVRAAVVWRGNPLGTVIRRWSWRRLRANSGPVVVAVRVERIGEPEPDWSFASRAVVRWVRGASRGHAVSSGSLPSEVHLPPVSGRVRLRTDVKGPRAGKREPNPMGVSG